MKIAVGSKNIAKVTAVTKAAASYWPDAEVNGYDVPSGVAAQPLGHNETCEGALNRAHAALLADETAQLGIGLEGGVVEYMGQPVMMGYVAITDGEREVVVPTVGTPLPQDWGTALKNGAELRPYVLAAGLPYDYAQGVVGLLTNGSVLRDDGFAMAVRCGLAPWLNPAAYAGTQEKAA